MRLARFSYRYFPKTDDGRSILAHAPQASVRNQSLGVNDVVRARGVRWASRGNVALARLGKGQWHGWRDACWPARVLPQLASALYCSSSVALVPP